MRLDPARDYVIIELEEQVGKKGHIYIPDSAKDAPIMGVVVAVGPGIWSDEESTFSGPLTTFSGPLVTKVGDKVLFARYSGADLEWEGKQLLLIHESEIICYVKEA